MERKDSQAKERRIEEAIQKGQASKCIEKKCVCWNFCSHNGKVKVTTCTSDLSTGFYRNDIPVGGEGVTYRDPLRQGRSGVFTKKKKKKH